MAFNLDEAKDEVWEKLTKLTGEELENLCTSLKFTVEPGKTSKRWAMIALITQNLASDHVDQMAMEDQKEMFDNILTTLDGMLSIRQLKKEEEAATAAASEASVSDNVTGSGSSTGTDGGQNTPNPVVVSMVDGFSKLAVQAKKSSGGNSGNSSAINTKLPEVVRLKREFRIDGTVGLGSPNSLSISSLDYYIKRAEEDGYKQEEIIAGCIRATKASSLRFYLESNPQMSMEEFMDALKLHYNDKQAIKLLNDLSLRSQADEFALEQNENELQFCMRMYGYCKKISKISQEEGQPIDESLIQKTFYQSLATGLKQGAVRLELQKTLREATLTERELLAEVRLLMNKELKH